ncbi:MAG: 4-hydroxythreonine-4-phosphate dehydrogenase PdxA [Rhodospirillaceae bacterium]|nr:4-hydroxythreonine-4-phosphate dehydrogenase PdxA [Rhodospirillaceae bacterium]|tara:strand:+ start:3847 stop:4905 length:1059 start_codon:yes stop_codon:yes gene_type:complete
MTGPARPPVVSGDRSGASPAPLAVTMGEPAGIGGEIALKAWTRRGEGVAPFFIIDDPARLDSLARELDLPAPIEAIKRPGEAAAVFGSALPVLKTSLAAGTVPGKPDPANAEAVMAAIETAVKLTMDGVAGAVVTNPIHKSTLYEAGFSYPGHTEFLAALSGIDTAPVMMLAADDLRVVPVTIHESLRDAAEILNTGLITQAGLVTAAALEADFAISRPRLAVAGLNPHAGEDGAMGSEETEIIAPAVEALREAGIEAFGPLSADTLFTPRKRETFDAALCMYHDQALIPIKALAFDRAVNVTLGLPFVRTSPDHGTALDIAGTGKADENSLMAALGMAAAMAGRRAAAEAA